MKRSILKAALSIALITSVGFSSELTLCGSKVEFSKKLSLNKIASYSTQNDDILIVVHTKDGLSSAQKDKLYLSGVKAIKYAGINSFYFLLDANSIEQIIEKFKFLDGFSIVNEKHKINEELKGINSSEEINIIVSLIQDNITKSEFKSMLDSAGVDYKNLKVSSDFNEARFSIYGIDLESVAKLAVVKEIRKQHKIDVIKPFSVKLETKDVEVAEETNVDDVWNNNTELDG
jgi:isopentenyl diphosphate isomerase/L-lactate dehydrogenase-like FMN-dependent dehydrogenase